MKLLRTAVISIIAVGLACGPAAQAASCDNLAGVAQVLGTIERVSSLVERTNLLISARLDQVNGGVALAVGGAKALEDKTYWDALSLETRIVTDIERLIAEMKKSRN